MIEQKTEPMRLYRGYEVLRILERRARSGGSGRPSTGPTTQWDVVGYKVVKDGVVKFSGKMFRDAKLWVDTKGVKHTEM